MKLFNLNHIKYENIFKEITIDGNIENNILDNKFTPELLDRYKQLYSSIFIVSEYNENKPDNIIIEIYKDDIILEYEFLFWYLNDIFNPYKELNKGRKLRVYDFSLINSLYEYLYNRS